MTEPEEREEETEANEEEPEKQPIVFQKYGDEVKRNDFELFLPRPKRYERKFRKRDLNSEFPWDESTKNSEKKSELLLSLAGRHFEGKRSSPDDTKASVEPSKGYNRYSLEKTQMSDSMTQTTSKVEETKSAGHLKASKKSLDPLLRMVNYHMTLERLSKKGVCKHEEKVGKNKLRRSLNYKPQFNEFLGSTAKHMNEVEIPNQVQRLHAKAKASDDLDEEALHNVMITQSKRFQVTTGEHDILIGTLRNRHDRETIQQVARVKTMIRIMDEITESIWNN